MYMEIIVFICWLHSSCLRIFMIRWSSTCYHLWWAFIRPLYSHCYPVRLAGAIKSNSVWETLFFFKHATPSSAHSSLSLICMVGGSRLSLKSLLLWSWVRGCPAFVAWDSFVSAFPIVLVSYFHWPIWQSPSWMFSWSHKNSSPWCFSWYCMSCSFSESPRSTFWRNNVFLMIIIPTWVMYTTLTFSLAVSLFWCVCL